MKDDSTLSAILQYYFISMTVFLKSVYLFTCLPFNLLFSDIISSNFVSLMAENEVLLICLYSNTYHLPQFTNTTGCVALECSKYSNGST